MAQTFLEFAKTEYAPYDHFPEFAEGASDYGNGVNDRGYHDVKAQAYDRGLEAAMRFIRGDHLK
jgi:hypothetical protein